MAKFLNGLLVGLITYLSRLQWLCCRGGARLSIPRFRVDFATMR
jgi:hypothetical protein